MSNNNNNLKNHWKMGIKISKNNLLNDRKNTLKITTSQSQNQSQINLINSIEKRRKLKSENQIYLLQDVTVTKVWMRRIIQQQINN